MSLLKGLQKTVFLSTAIAVVSFGSQSYAADTVSDVAHASVSVGTTLSITETTPIKFGNVTVTFASATGDANVVMTPQGVRTATAGSDSLALLNGATNTVPGGDDAGSESPGFYAITGANNNSNIYITFAKTGSPNALIDANHPTNNVVLGTAPDNFTVDTLTFNSSGSDLYGNYITTTGTTATVQVGGTLHTVAGASYADGTYRGTFDIMASY